jgi:hypothetical protein
MVGDTNVISAFWSSTTCQALVHKVGRDQSKTTKELLHIASWHAPGEEVIKAVFVEGNGKSAPGSSWGAPSKATGNGAKKGAKGSKRGKSGAPNRSQLLAATTMTTRKQMALMRSMLWPLSMISCTRQDNRMNTSSNFLNRPIRTMCTM